MGRLQRVRACLSAGAVAMGLSVASPPAVSAGPAIVATFTVTNVNDSGPGSLRQAILDANAHPGYDLIAFAIGTGPQTISPLSQLPTVTDPAILDATTQPGFTGAPIIELNGSSAGVAHGLSVSAGSSTIRGFVINRFQAFGVWIGFGGGDVVAGNYIGTDMSGTSARPNASNGLVILGPSTGNMVGGPTAADRNVISASGDKGVVIAQGGSATVQGNYLGTDVTGTVALPNHFFGISFEPGYSSRVVGNLISGNGVSGVNVISGSSGNVFEGNRIGTNASGSAPLGNGVWGVLIDNSSNNTIGRGNLISGNAQNGVVVNGAQSANNVVAGNLIGTDISGTHALGNGTDGILINQSAQTVIGGPSESDRNVISGNAFNGVNLSGSGTTGTVIQGNFIGTDRTGTASIPNSTASPAAGVGLFGSFNNLIGGTTPGARNIISGNRFSGVDVWQGSYGNRIEGNYIGTDVTGTQPLGNQDGVRTYSVSGNTLGGVESGAGNLISGNRRIGVLLYGPGGTAVQGNYIGTDRSGTARVPNALSGLVLDNSSGNSMYRNVVSGNDLSGIELSGAGSTNNVLQGNFIGTDSAGASAVPNALFGVFMNAGASHNTVGGVGADARNVISGNQATGLTIVDPISTANTVLGNYIGIESSGMHALPNHGDGVSLYGSSGNTVGGSTAGSRNVVSGNDFSGVSSQGGDHNTIQGNYVGIDAAGTHAVPNGGHGVALFSSGSNLVGGSTSAERNVISGNGGHGIGTFGGAVGNTIQGNYVGTDASGSAAIPNQGAGIGLADSPSSLVVGNVSAGNAFEGIDLSGDSSHTTIQGNFIGTDRTGTHELGNGTSGVLIEGGTDILIGGTTAAARNVISGNTDCGVNIFGSTAMRNVIEGNYIGTDATGTRPLGNHNIGVQISDGVGNTVGGTPAGAGNVISGNLNTGVQINNSQGANFIQGNRIGTDPTGATAVGNGPGPGLGGFGIWIGFAAGTVISGNTIAGNNADGMALFGDTATNNVVQRNYIGTNGAGAALANHGNGIIIDANASGNQISGNVIANNDFNGVVVSFGVRNTIRSNSIYSNGAMGIDLNNDGVTLNDKGDKDGGANNSQNFPVLSRVVGTPANLVIEGSIDTPNPQNVTIEIYANASPNPGADYTGYGEGQTLIATLKPNAGGRFAVVLPAVPKGTVISATATDAQGNTSEFALDKVA